MTPEQFCYWLQGYAEIKGGWEEPTAGEWEIIKDHLELVFKKETPMYIKPYVSPMLDHKWPHDPTNPFYIPTQLTTTC